MHEHIGSSPTDAGGAIDLPDDDRERPDISISIIVHDLRFHLSVIQDLLEQLGEAHQQSTENLHFKMTLIVNACNHLQSIVNQGMKQALRMCLAKQTG
jgi:hypothetical protein